MRQLFFFVFIFLIIAIPSTSYSCVESKAIKEWNTPDPKDKGKQDWQKKRPFTTYNFNLSEAELHFFSEYLTNAFTTGVKQDRAYFVPKAIKRFGSKSSASLITLILINDTVPWSACMHKEKSAALDHLHTLAKENICLKKSVPPLIRAIQTGYVLEGYRNALETLTIITGIDPGFTDEFIKKFVTGRPVSDEDIKKYDAMMKEWQNWWLKNKGNDSIQGCQLKK